MKNDLDLCAIFDCDFEATEKLLGDDNKMILLCKTHYEFVKKAMERRFTND